jgi:gliding motility-associated-like protein
VELFQPGSAIGANMVGFTVYKTNSCIPSRADESTLLRPIETFGKTDYPCVIETGDYYIQVSGNNNANGPIYITVELTDGSPTFYDKPGDAYVFGNLNLNKNTHVDFNVKCQSIDDNSEICSPSPTFKTFTKSTWHVFTTPNYFDWIAVAISGSNQKSGGAIVGYRIYKGDAKVTPVASMISVVTCDSLGFYNERIDVKSFSCGQLATNSTYTIQLLYPADFESDVRLAVSWNGTSSTRAPQPVNTIPAANQLGVLPSNGGGITTNAATDYFGCNSRHNNYNCPKSLPSTGLVKYIGSTQFGVPKNFAYNLSNFYSFTINSSSSVSINTNSSYRGDAPFYLRLFKQNLTASCAGLDTANIVAQTFSSLSFECMTPGDYVLQVMGTDTAIEKNEFFYSFNSGSLTTGNSPLNLFRHLGSPFDLNIRVKSVSAINKFSLSAAGAFDTINSVSNVMQPMVPGVTYTSKIDTFGCANTVMPLDLDACVTVSTKAMYREFNVPDSGLLTVFTNSTLNNYYNKIYYNKIYKGDANGLATAQSAFAYPNTISGLTPQTVCLESNPPPPYIVSTIKTCVLPGTYTHVNFGNSNIIGESNNVQVRFDTLINKFYDLAHAEDIGNILSTIPPAGGTITSVADYFTCKDNAIVIDSIQPCKEDYGVITSTKAIYRQFYLSSAASISISSLGVNGGPTKFTMFKGKATDGIAALTAMPSKYRCIYELVTSECDLLAAGWYTVVAYGWGPSYDNPMRDLNSLNGGLPAYSGMVGSGNKIAITLKVPSCPPAKYNRPHKAAIDTLTGQPFLIQWAPRVGHTAAYPKTDTTYTLSTETFGCANDTPFVSHPVAACGPLSAKVAYWVFKITQESFVGINTENYWHGWTNLFGYSIMVYAGNARTDSALFATAQPIQPCLLSLGHTQLSKLQPGTYTIVIFAPGDAVCKTVTPKIYIDQVGYSRFDHANNAYDFGQIKPDSVWYNGKPGDINPLNPGRAPSNDFFYCTTGAQATDPIIGCASRVLPNVYQPGNNIPLFTSNYSAGGGYPLGVARNLWYTFTADKGGLVKVRVSNKTIDKGWTYNYHVLKSNVDGTLPFSTVVSSGGVDSTMVQGLNVVARNDDNDGCDGGKEVSFFRETCTPIPERYYIVVANRVPSIGWVRGFSNPEWMYPNHQVEVEVLFDSANAVLPKFDQYYQANNIGTNLGPGIYKGATDNYSCATKDATDPMPKGNCTIKSLWYKFSTTVSGNIKFRMYNVTKAYWEIGPSRFQLFRQIIPGDSTVNGLQHIKGTLLDEGGPNGYYFTDCISPGTYYILLPNCDASGGEVYPNITLTENAGDFCSRPVFASLTGAGTKTASATITCHTIGTDYGEFNPTLTCPPNAITKNYKSTWYRLDIGGTDTLDVSVYINENTNASSSSIKYRMMTGNCNAMQEQSCVLDALTRNTYKCLAPGNSYFIQVFTPADAIGSIDLVVEAVKKTAACLPPLPCIAVSNFSTQFDCTKDRNVTFINSSTYGTSIQYDWDFGYNNQKSNAIVPQFFYPALTSAATYTARLIVTNMDCGKKDTSYQTLTIPARPAVNLGNDTIICTKGASVLLNATAHAGSSYQWNFGGTTPTTTIAPNGTQVASVAVTYNSCIARDTIIVHVTPLTKRPMKTVALCNVYNVDLDANQGNNETYKWNTGATSSKINVEPPGYYWCDLYLNGCVIRDSFLVVNPAATQQVKKVNVCQGNLPYIADATVSGATAYKWNDNSTNAKLSITKAGLYWVDITLSGCTFRDTLLVTIDSFRTAAITAKICGGQSYTMPTGKVISIAGIYKDSIRNVRGCDSIITTVTLIVDTVKRVSSSVFICAGQTYTMPGGKVINTAGNYIDTVKHKSGCDSLISNVTLTVAVVNRVSTTATICIGKSFALPSGKLVSIAGIYSDTLKAKAGCDSLITTVDLKVLAPIVNTTNASVCFGKTFTLPSGRVVNASGFYKDTVRYVVGCDSLISNITLSVGNAIIENKNAFLCAGLQYTLPSSKSVNTTGIYRDTVRSVGGCDSLISTINLTVQNAATQNLNAFVCSGQLYSLPTGKKVNTTGIYNDTLRYTTGCDSIRYTINLKVFTTAINTQNVSLCFGATYTLPSGKILSSSGNYKDTIRYTNGCDSLISNITLSIGTAIIDNKNAFLCAGLLYTLPSGKKVSTTGIYKDTVRSIGGCDSLMSAINLIVQNAILQNLNASICGGRFYNLPSGKKVNTSGIYNDTLRYTTGCDSMRYTINLKVYNAITNNQNISICAGKNYMLPSGKIINATGNYKDTILYTNGCDSLITNINLNVSDPLRQSNTVFICLGQPHRLPSGRMVMVAGVYNDTLRTALGCDSLISSTTLNVDAPQLRNVNASICSNAKYTSPSGKLFTTAGNYNDTLRNNRGCDSIHFAIKLNVLSVMRQSKTDTICNGQNYKLPGGKNVSVAGTYIDTLKTVNGCDSIITTSLHVRLPITVMIMSRTAICLGDTAAITAIASGGNGGPYVYSWSGVSGNGNKVIVTPAFTNNTYSVSVSDGCTIAAATASINVQTIAPPKPGLNGGTTTICRGASATLNASGGTTYQWSPSTALSNTSIANPIANPIADTWYKVTVTTAQGCVDKDSLLVKVTQPFTLTASRDTFVCIGSAVQINAIGAIRYSWAGNGITNATAASINVKPNATATYTVTGFGSDGCFTQTKNITITVIPLPIVNAGSDTSVMVGSSFVLRPSYSSDVNQYRWTPSQYLNCTICATPTTTPREPIIYTVTARNQYQCEASDSRKIDLICNNESVFVPNTFTPNNDGVNDVWYPRGSGIKSIRFIRVFNRWGQLIFERLNFNADDRSAGWDGTFKGQPLPADVYVYSLGMVCDNNQVVETRGNVMVVR